MIDRKRTVGKCSAGSTIKIAKAFLHKWEEPCISGINGSGTVFFSGCNLKCVFCQNYKISQENFGKELSLKEFEQIILNLQQKGAHNINFVSPSHYTLSVAECLKRLYGRLRIPVLYNSNGFDSTNSLKHLEGLVNIYLPDIKYYKNESSLKYSNAKDYFNTATNAVLEMYRQTGKAQFNEDGLMQKGLIIRHLVLPGMTGESIKILDWIRSNLPSDDIVVSIMSQYTPFYNSYLYPEIDRRIIRKEYEKVLNHFLKLDFANGYIQERDSADSKYVPDFDLEGI
jgi:putative pyruvate formate lyase activating enzyme